MENNAQGETPGIRSAERSQANGAGNEGRKERTGGNSSEHEYLSLGTNGETGPGQNSNYIATLAGGVVEQLILDAEDRLKVARECVDWYRREEEKELSRLDNLRKLHGLAEQMKHQQPSE